MKPSEITFSQHYVSRHTQPRSIFGTLLRWMVESDREFRKAQGQLDTVSRHI